ncbi:unnamed protein product [Arctogadus glacialis]
MQVIRLLRKGLQEDGAHALEKDFQALHCKMGSISAKNRQYLQKIRIDEKDPDATDHHMRTFKEIYERDKAEMSLDVYYRLLPKWAKRVQEIQSKMEEVLSHFKEESPP